MKKNLLIRVFFLFLFIIIAVVFIRTNEVAALQELSTTNPKIIFEYGSSTYEYTMQELGLQRIGKCEGTNLTGELITCKDPTLLSYKLYCLSQRINKLPVDASMFTDEKGQIRIVPEQEGFALDLATLITELGNTGIYREKYELPMKKLLPYITKEQLKKKYPDNLWAQYSTLLADIPDRTENVRLASKELDGLLIKPGEEISFNKIVGPREKERGYREAKVIVRGSYESGLGGGVCQVSSTLYNTLLLAGLEIKERHNHSVRISYVPLGRDATVVYGGKDLVFINNTESFLFLKTSLEGLKLTINLYGNDIRTEDQIKVYTKTVKKLPFSKIEIPDESLDPGTKKVISQGQNGYLTETYRVYNTIDGLIEELISRDYYQAISSKIAVAP